jgi:ABC-2 type transport system permease protein
MVKVIAVALREYRAAVHTKAFLIGLVMMPVICAISIVVQLLVNKAENETTKKYAIVDRTGELRESLDRAMDRHNTFEILNVETKNREAPIYSLIHIEPSADDRESIVAQRLALSQRQAKGEFEGLLEIGKDVFEILPPSASGAPDDRHDIRFQSDKVAERDFPRWAGRVVNSAIQERRFERQSITADDVRRIQTLVPVRQKALTKKNPRTGEIEEASEEARLVSFFLPGALVTLMFVMVLLGAVPAMQGVVEEKQQRIVEVLLGCVTPFQLMLGKLLGVIAVSLTISAVYLGGGYLVALRYGVTSTLPGDVMAWFVFFMVLAVLVYGSLFMAVGAAANDLKELQSLQMPVMMTVTLPVLLLGAVLRDPNGKVALIGSFVPFTAPMLMMARLASPAGVAAWQPIVAAFGVLVASMVCVWAAGRIFRVGLLMQGKGVHLADLARWILRG